MPLPVMAVLLSLELAYSRLLVDIAGRLWVEHGLIPRDREWQTRPFQYDVYSPDLEPLGFLSVPFRIEYATDNHIYRIGLGQEGEWGVVSIPITL